MQVEYVFRHANGDESVKNYALKKSEHLKKFFHGKLHVQWVFDHQKTDYFVKVHILGDHLEIVTESHGQNWIEALDVTTEKAETILRKKKEEKVSHSAQ